jgi:transcriptional regulator with XRE-family HTH domain
MINIFLGKNIRHLRKKSFQNQGHIALLVDKGQTTIGNWEKGVSEPSIRDLLILSNYFGIPVDMLLKVDLARAEQFMSKPAFEDQEGDAAKAARYKHDHNVDDQSMVREKPGDALTPILEEIKSIREEIAEIKSRI